MTEILYEVGMVWPWLCHLNYELIVKLSRIVIGCSLSHLAFFCCNPTLLVTLLNNSFKVLSCLFFPKSPFHTCYTGEN